MLSAIKKITPPLGQVGGPQTSVPLVAKAERTIRPEAVAFGVFGLITALAALVMSGQVISGWCAATLPTARSCERWGRGDDHLRRARRCRRRGGNRGAAAWRWRSCCRPWPRSGRSGRCTQTGVAFDWTVLVSGSPSWSSCSAGRRWLWPGGSRRTVPAGPALTSGAVPGWPRRPPPAACRRRGDRHPLGSRPVLRARGRPVRSALLGSVIAVMVVTASITFGSSLSFLVSHPPLYGWGGTTRCCRASRPPRTCRRPRPPPCSITTRWWLTGPGCTSST